VGAHIAVAKRNAASLRRAVRAKIARQLFQIYRAPGNIVYPDVPMKCSCPKLMSFQIYSEHESYATSPVGSTSPSTLPRPRPRDHKHSACQTDSIGIKTPELLLDRRYESSFI